MFRLLRRRVIFELVVIALFTATTIGPAAAATVQLRMATPAPDGSSWMKILSKGSAEVELKTAKRVTVKWYAGGVQGDERDVVRKINLGQLDGGALTAVGLSMIDESIRVLELPGLFGTVEELDYVTDKLWPYFQRKFEAKGFRLQERGDVGWVHIMSKNEIKSLADLKSQRAWLWGDDVVMRAMYRKLGVSGVPLGVPEVEPALTTGRINAVYGSPLAAVALQWNTKVNYMASVPWSYAIEATVVKLDVLKKVSSEDQALITKVDNGISKTLRAQVRKDNESAKKQMERKGVKITDTSATMVAGLAKAAQDVWTELTGKVFSKAELDQVLKLRAEYRAKNPPIVNSPASTS